MTLRYLIASILQLLAIGELVEVFGKLRIAAFQLSSPSIVPSMRDELLLRAIQRGTRFFIWKRGWTLDQPLSNRELVQAYRALLSMVARTTIPYLNDAEQLGEYRREARRYLIEVVAFHRNVRRNLEKQSPRRA